MSEIMAKYSNKTHLFFSQLFFTIFYATQVLVKMFNGFCCIWLHEAGVNPRSWVLRFLFEYLDHLFNVPWKRRCHEYQDKVSVFTSRLNSFEIFKEGTGERRLIVSQVRIRMGMLHYVRRQAEINTIFSQIRPLNSVWGPCTKH